MFRSFGILLMMVLFLLTATDIHSQGEPIYIRITVQIANVRTAPESGSPVIGQFKLGDILLVSAHAGNWYVVELPDENRNKLTGYIHESIVELVAAGESVVPKNFPFPPASQTRQNTPETSQELAKPVRRGKLKIVGGMALSDIVETGNPVTFGWAHQWKSSSLGGIGFEMGGTRLFLELGIFYFPAGVRRVQPPPGTDLLTFTYTTKMLTIPLVVKYKFKSGVSPYLCAGGEAGFALTHRMQVSTSEVEGEYNLLESINRLYYGTVFGIGLEIPFGTAALQLEGRFHLGLSNQWLEPGPGESLKFRSLSGLVALRF